jgi:hypothetical protein
VPVKLDALVVAIALFVGRLLESAARTLDVALAATIGLLSFRSFDNGRLGCGSPRRRRCNCRLPLDRRDGSRRKAICACRESNDQKGADYRCNRFSFHAYGRLVCPCSPLRER